MEKGTPNQKKKILIVSGSPRKNGDGARILETLVHLLKNLVNVEFEYLYLKDRHIEFCRGCSSCLKKSEEACPIKDDMPEIRESFYRANGFIFSTPVYVRTLSALLKLFFDRTFYWLHRPRFFGKSAIIFSNGDIAGMKETLKYLNMPITTIGMHVSGKIGVASPAFMSSEKYKAGVVKEMEKAARNFVQTLESVKKPQPNFSDIVRFHRWKTKTILHKDQMPYDYEYWGKNGWFKIDYFYPARVTRLQKGILSIISKLVLGQMKRKALIN